MQNYLWIALGSALGGMTRHWFTEIGARWLGTAFPWGTLTVNVLGSFLIGLVFSLVGPAGRFDMATGAKLFVMVGFCGGYTTFSSFSLQTLTLAQEGEWLRAGLYVVGSVVLCLFAVWIGHTLGSTGGVTE
jgi:CrcB protein